MKASMLPCAFGLLYTHTISLRLLARTESEFRPTFGCLCVNQTQFPSASTYSRHYYLFLMTCSCSPRLPLLSIQHSRVCLRANPKEWIVGLGIAVSLISSLHLIKLRFYCTRLSSRSCITEKIYKTKLWKRRRSKTKLQNTPSCIYSGANTPLPLLQMTPQLCRRSHQSVLWKYTKIPDLLV